jgi:hypothetical protein
MMLLEHSSDPLGLSFENLRTVPPIAIALAVRGDKRVA